MQYINKWQQGIKKRVNLFFLRIPFAIFAVDTIVIQKQAQWHYH